jgi:S1-C subfamily serine protease
MRRNLLLASGVLTIVLLAACVPTRTVTSAPPLTTGDAAVADVVDRVLPAVVNVTTDVFQADGFGGVREGQGVGTGFIVDPDGYIVTNCHVVERATQIAVFTSEADPRRFDARVVGGDCLHDLAVLKVDAEGLPTVPLGTSDSLRLGQEVVAIGYALALEGGPTVTSGIVSSLDRTIQAQDPNCEACGPDGVRTYTDVIQTDAAINHGNSGGPLVDMAGRVVGINSAGSDGAENIGFAIAIDAAADTIRGAIEDPLAATAYLGVQTLDVTPEAAYQLGLSVDSGAYVVAASSDGPAQAAGIERGDVIVGIEGEPVEGAEDVGAIIGGLAVGDSIAVDVVGADGDRRSLDVILGSRPLPVDLP